MSDYIRAEEPYFYGVRGIGFVYHGDWADPELVWHGKCLNYHDVETPLYEDFCEEFKDANGRTPTDKEADKLFPAWVKANAYKAREYCRNLIECKCFYGGGARA